MALPHGLLRLLAITCAATIANVYYAQPLLPTIGHGLGSSESAAGIVVTATQLGFAVGLLFVVPLGDIVARRPLISTLLAVDAVAFVASAVAPGLHVLAALAVLVGTSSVVVQIVIPYAATLARASSGPASSEPWWAPSCSGSCCPVPSPASSPAWQAGAASTPWPPG
ncbi:hypothetical protein AB0J86_05390 [Micromonospora sp. NPDC049559]|uniref:hypothetical protein n=1 Tax=Micromonospora sp. NPDC049559 TaxID=3155923 RepID=UPI00342E5022